MASDNKILVRKEIEDTYIYANLNAEHTAIFLFN